MRKLLPGVFASLMFLLAFSVSAQDAVPVKDAVKEVVAAVGDVAPVSVSLTEEGAEMTDKYQDAVLEASIKHGEALAQVSLASELSGESIPHVQ